VKTVRFSEDINSKDGQILIVHIIRISFFLVFSIQNLNSVPWKELRYMRKKSESWQFIKSKEKKGETWYVDFYDNGRRVRKAVG